MPRRELLVEGKDEKYVIEHLCRNHGIDSFREFQFIEIDAAASGLKGQEGAGGIDSLLPQIPVRLKAMRDGDRLAIIVDADEDAAGRWTQIRDRLRSVLPNARVPGSPTLDRTIIDFDDGRQAIRIGVWIMPDNRLSGMLEDLLSQLVPREKQVLLPVIEDFLNAAETLSEFPRAKARVHAYLAVQPEPGKPLGLAITFRYLAADSPIVEPFVAWLRRTLIES